MPTSLWARDNIGWLIALGVALLLLPFGIWFALRKPAPVRTPSEASRAEAAA